MTGQLFATPTLIMPTSISPFNVRFLAALQRRNGRQVICYYSRLLSFIAFRALTTRVLPPPQRRIYDDDITAAAPSFR